MSPVFSPERSCNCRFRGLKAETFLISHIHRESLNLQAEPGNGLGAAETERNPAEPLSALQALRSVLIPLGCFTHDI